MDRPNDSFVWSAGLPEYVFDYFCVFLVCPRYTKTGKVSRWFIGGLGPSGLDIWDPLMKGIVT